MYNSDIEGAKVLVSKYEALRSEIGKVIVGQHDIIHNTILSIFAKATCFWLVCRDWLRPCW